MKIKFLFLAIAMMLMASGAFAHALWIQTSGTGIKGQPVTVKVFFGEYADKSPDSTAKWFSNLNNFKLTLTTPDGKTQLLNTQADVLNHTATFIPHQDGVYTLSIVHHVADKHKNNRIEYYAFTDVKIGRAKNASIPPKEALLAFKKSKKLSYSLSYKQTAFADKKIEIINPAFEKTRTTTNAKGEINFKPTVKGGYFMTAMEEEKDNSSEKTWHVATYYTEAN